MSWRRAWLAMVAATLLLIGLGPPRAAAAGSRVCKPRRAPLATVIVIQSSGFVLPAVDEPRECHAFARRGFRASELTVPVRDLPGAVRAAQVAARRGGSFGRRVYAFGLSAGGTLAALLAVEGQVDGAVAVAAPTNLLDWAPGGAAARERWRNAAAYWREVGATRPERRAASPVHQVTRRAAPLLLLHSREDEIVPFAQARALQREHPLARLRRLRGHHLQSQAFLAPALAWLERESTRPETQIR
jgi:dienelactone hydrolase